MARYEGGHLNLVGTQWPVLALLGLELWLDQPRILNALLTGLAISFAALSSWYYAFIVALMLPIYLLLRGAGLRRFFTDRRVWIGAGLALALVVILCGPFALLYVEVAQQGGSRAPLEDAIFWSASPLDYLVPNPHHPVWGSAMQAILWPFPNLEMPFEFMHSIDWITLLLAFIGSRHTGGGRWRALKWVTVVAFILSLGPALKLGRLPLGIPLPAALVREIVPVVGGIRSWGRFAVFATLGVSVLAAAGLCCGSC